LFQIAVDSIHIQDRTVSRLSIPIHVFDPGIVIAGLLGDWPDAVMATKLKLYSTSHSRFLMQTDEPSAWTNVVLTSCT